MEEKVVLTNFRTPESLHHKFKEISLRERKNMGDILKELVEEYVKVHGEGNPVYPLDKWTEGGFKMYPAFGESVPMKWQPYLNKCTEKELKEIVDRADFLKQKANERLKLVS